MKMGLIASLFFVHSLGLAEPVWVRSAEGAESTFSAFVAGEGLSQLRYSDAAFNRDRKSSDSWRYREAFEVLQRQILNGDPATLAGLIQSFIHKWQPRTRDETQAWMIHYAYLRLAQYSTPSGEWLRAAANWAPEFIPDESIFPPPLIQEYRRQQTEVRLQKLDLKSRWPWIRIAILNGRVVKSTDIDSIQASPENMQLSLYSDSHWPLHLSGSWTQIQKEVEAKLQPILVGGCGNYKTSENQTPGLEPVPFIEPECRSTEPKSLSSTPLDLPKVGRLSSESPQAFWQSKWFWVGASVIATGYLIYQNQNAKESQPTPTTSYAE